MKSLATIIKCLIGATGSAILFVACNGNGLVASSPQSNIASYDSHRVSNSRGVLYVANVQSSTVTLYREGKTALLRSVSEGINNPQSLAFAGKNIFVANAGSPHQGSGVGTVSVYADRGKKRVRTISRGIRRPRALAIDKLGNLYVANHFDVTVYAPGKSSVLHRIRIRGPMSLAIDASGNLYVGNGNTVNVYAPGAVSPELTISQGISYAAASAFDTVGNIYVANQIAPGPSGGVGTVTVYAPGSGSLLRTISQGVVEPGAINFDGSGNLYVANSSSGSQGSSVTVYPPQSGSILRTITQGISGPDALAFDTSGDLYVANFGGNSVTVYGPGGVIPLRSISKGVFYPRALAFGT